MNIFHESIESLVREFNTNLTRGLSEQEAAARLNRDGPNVLPKGKQVTWVSIFLSQFQSPLIYILLFAAVIIFFVGERKLDAFIISGILFFNAIIGTIQEGRTSNIVASLRRFLKTKSIVIRDGKNQIIDDKDLVVGDIIVLKEGERVPADARVISAQRLQLDESILTGESVPVYKTEESLQEDIPVAEQTNMVFKGTYVIAGWGHALVVATGVSTQIGQIQATIEEIDTDIPLKRELNRLSYIILLFILLLCSILLVIGLFMGHPWKELLVMLTALFICVVPEGLPVVLTLVLVTGAYRMARQNVLVKNLQGVEALGRTDVIVIDKTGTLTRNEMIVTSVMTPTNTYKVTGEGYFDTGDILLADTILTKGEDHTLQEIGIACALLNTAEVFYNKKVRLFEIKGDPTEAALKILAQKIGCNQDQLKTQYTQEYEIPFDSHLKYHAGFFVHDTKGIAYIIGAPEILFTMTHEVPVTLKKSLEDLLKQGLRTISVGSKEFDPTIMTGHYSTTELFTHYQKLLTNITMLGICGIQDSIRPEVQEIVNQARLAGLQVIMATGDHKDTAEYVAKEVGIYKPGDHIIEGPVFHTMQDADLHTKLNTITVFARVSPQDKVRIIQLFHQQNKVVAMTGDGVNDVPSLVAADLGIAMGGIGTEVAKQAGDLILLDDSFVNIIHAIEQGRHIFYTLRRVILYFFATNMGEILIVLFALFTYLPLPLTAAQILWLNLVTDGFLDVGLSMEPQEPDLLNAQWLKQKLHLVDRNLILKTMYLAIPMGISSLMMFRWAYNGTPYSLDYARTMTLITMAMFQWFNAWNCRSEGKSLLQIGLFSNKWLILVTFFVLSLQLGVVYIPFMQFIFKTVPLSLHDWTIILCLSGSIIFIEEIRKWIMRRFSHA